jgi:hypothetical protein
MAYTQNNNPFKRKKKSPFRIKKKKKTRKEKKEEKRIQEEFKNLEVLHKPVTEIT